jgi:hypothetical protein
VRRMLGRMLEAWRGTPPAPPAPDDRPVGSLTVGELARLMGIADLEVARRMAAATMQRQQQIAERTQAIFRDLERIQVAEVPQRMRTVADLRHWCERMERTFFGPDMAPGLTIAVAYAVADERPRPMTTGTPNPKAN